MEDSARRRLGCEPLARIDELIERIELLGSDGAANTLALLQDLPHDQRVALDLRLSHRG